MGSEGHNPSSIMAWRLPPLLGLVGSEDSDWRPLWQMEDWPPGVSSLGTLAQEFSGTELSVTDSGRVPGGVRLSCLWVREWLSPGLQSQSPLKVTGVA